MKIKEMLAKIIEKGDSKDMYRLNDMLDELICDLKEQKPKLYKEYKMELYEIAYGNVINQEMAKDIIEKMKPYGMKWSLEETRQVQRQYNLEKIRDIDFWLVMNSAYNDFHDMFDEELDNYVRYSKCFIDDKDAKTDKIFLYYMTIPE